MKTQRISSSRRGFTLMELMVAMAITTIIVSVLVSITSIAMDTWNRSRAELRAARQAKAMIDTMAHDFESLVSRKGNNNEWLSAEAADSGELQQLGDKAHSTNAVKLVFFTAATDRYNGEVGNNEKDKGGDVSCVGYQLTYKDPITKGGNGKFETFVMNRLLKDPDVTFQNLLGKTDTTNEGSGGLDAVFQALYGTELTGTGDSSSNNFVCENIFQFSVTFQVQGTHMEGTVPTVVTVPVTVGGTASEQSCRTFRIQGTGIDTDATAGTLSVDELKAGRVTSISIAVTVLSDFGVDQLKTRNLSKEEQSKFLEKNSFQYSKTVPIPSM